MPFVFVLRRVDSAAQFRELAEQYPSKRDAASSQDVWQQANELHMIRGWLLRTSGKAAQWNNPATRMWLGHEDALLCCFFAFKDEVQRRYDRYVADPTLPLEKRSSDKWPTERSGPNVSLPPWTTDERMIARHREVLVARNPDWWRRVAGLEDVQPRGFGYLWPCQCGECNDGRSDGVSNYCVKGEWQLLEPKKFFTTSKGRDDAFCSPLVDPSVGSSNAALKYADEAALKAAKEALKASKKPAAKKRKKK
jgi:hypothetical protein